MKLLNLLCLVASLVVGGMAVAIEPPDMPARCECGPGCTCGPNCECGAASMLASEECDPPAVSVRRQAYSVPFQSYSIAAPVSYTTVGVSATAFATSGQTAVTTVRRTKATDSGVPRYAVVRRVGWFLGHRRQAVEACVCADLGPAPEQSIEPPLAVAAPQVQYQTVMEKRQVTRCVPQTETVQVPVLRTVMEPRQVTRMVAQTETIEVPVTRAVTAPLAAAAPAVSAQAPQYSVTASPLMLTAPVATQECYTDRFGRQHCRTVIH